MNPTLSVFNRLNDYFGEDNLVAWSDSFVGLPKATRTRRLKKLVLAMMKNSTDKWLDNLGFDLTDWTVLWDMVQAARNDALHPWPATFTLPAMCQR